MTPTLILVGPLPESEEPPDEPDPQAAARRAATTGRVRAERRRSRIMGSSCGRRRPPASACEPVRRTLHILSTKVKSILPTFSPAGNIVDKVADIGLRSANQARGIKIAEDVMAAHYVVRSVDRADNDTITALREVGVAAVHEAAGRIGLLGAAVQARQAGVAIAGSAITVSCHPGDNLMIHAAVEVCRPGDILVVTTTSPSTDGMFGDLLATSLRAQGVIGLVSD